MALIPQLFDAKVMHHRHAPKANGFTYRSAYLSLPIDKKGKSYPKDSLAINRPSLVSFYDKDHGKRDGSDLYDWAKMILKKEKLDKVTDQILLITLPRLCGYVFNPVSFWLCLDKQGNLRALISEVNNTFGETHTYLCAKENHAIIGADDWLVSDKLLYVSPFLEKEGHYRFRISMRQNKLGIWINHHDGEDRLVLSTSLTGEMKPLTKKSLLGAFFIFPLTAFKTISLIHWQALKIWLKGIKFVSRPQHGPPTVSSHLENMTRAPYHSDRQHVETSISDR